MYSISPLPPTEDIVNLTKVSVGWSPSPKWNYAFFEGSICCKQVKFSDEILKTLTILAASVVIRKMTSDTASTTVLSYPGRLIEHWCFFAKGGHLFELGGWVELIEHWAVNRSFTVQQWDFLVIYCYYFFILTQRKPEL